MKELRWDPSGVRSPSSLSLIPTGSKTCRASPWLGCDVLPLTTVKGNGLKIPSVMPLKAIDNRRKIALKGNWKWQWGLGMIQAQNLSFFTQKNPTHFWKTNKWQEKWYLMCLMQRKAVGGEQMKRRESLLAPQAKQVQAVVGKTCSSGPRVHAGNYPDPWVWLSVKHFALHLVRYFVICMQAFIRTQLVVT